MKLLFRRNHDGCIVEPVQVMALTKNVLLCHQASGKVFRTPTSTLPQFFTVHTHDIERGDVLRDIRDGQLWVVEYTSQHGLRMQTRKGGVVGNVQRGMTYFGLIHFERVGRKYSLRDRQPHECATYDATQVQSKIRRATREIVNRFDAVTNAQRHAQEYGVGFIRVERDGSMNAIDPRSVILK
ncbi:hypothetical protein P9641_gp25 [Escherichia phage Gluttony_ev152]|uniref:Uncharacterized protein n=1 Tax=Escherichia phage Gluttony_ev152 TaxID=2742948 RepID=A0A653FUC7_9CAUD|nr:hypothetical protein P9641_gp25 [Escherichia phage Gluttony_ev152]VUF53528.1 hypothetical protein [Escherichia phage Gluttony_ev152]